MYERVDVN